MVGFHMLNYKIIGSFAIARGFNVFKPFAAEFCVYRIENGNFFIDYHIGIIRHAVGNFILPLEQIDVVIVYAYVFNAFNNFVYHNYKYLIKFFIQFSAYAHFFI